MKMFIPHPGNMIRLTADWTFRLFHEYRNSDLFEGLDMDTRWQPTSCEKVTLPAGTVLKIDRVYIRSNREYDSITFRTVASPDGRLATRKMGGTGKSRRFWSKLHDVNEIEYERADDVA